MLMKMARPVRKSERRGELLQAGAVGVSVVLYLALANVVIGRLPDKTNP
jgi:hypothetical protein